MSLIRPGIIIVGIAGLAWAQMSFEVASIRPSGPKSVRGSDGGPGSKDPTRYTFGRASLLDFLLVAYHVDTFQISSPVPLDGAEFDLAVRIPAGASKEVFRVMLQNLLAVRFHLRLHIVSKEFPAYELVVAKTGLKLGSSGQATPREWLQAGFPDLAPDRPGMVANNSFSGGVELTRMKAQQEPLSVLAGMLRTLDDRPIVDRTGLTDKYDFTLEFSKESLSAAADGPPQSPPAPGLKTALQQQLGLQLVEKRIPFDVLMIDSVDKMPTEN